MKTREEELCEMTDLVIKMTWTQTVFASLFDKRDPDAKVRSEHGEIFLTLYEAMICHFCLAVEILFEKKEKATSLLGLVRKAEPATAAKLETKISEHADVIRTFESFRHQVYAHRWQAKKPQEVFDEVKISPNSMREVTALAQFVLLELVGEINEDKGQS